MKKGALIQYKESSMPKIISYFKTPRVIDTLRIAHEKETLEIYQIEYPMTAEEGRSARKNRLLERILQNNQIEAVFEVGGRASEIQALKEWGALIKLNLTKSFIGFIRQEIDEYTIDFLSEDASGIIIYDGDHREGYSKTIHDQQKNDIFTRVMVSKGMSVVFSKDLKKAIEASQVLLLDDATNLEAYSGLLKGKTVLGENASVNGMQRSTRAIGRIILWHEPLEQIPDKSDVLSFNNEILAIACQLFKPMKPIDFMKLFPYIYTVDSDGEPRAL